jgi:hypothetical protein
VPLSAVAASVAAVDVHLDRLFAGSARPGAENRTIG